MNNSQNNHTPYWQNWRLKDDRWNSAIWKKRINIHLLSMMQLDDLRLPWDLMSELWRYLIPVVGKKWNWRIFKDFLNIISSHASATEEDLLGILKLLTKYSKSFFIRRDFKTFYTEPSSCSCAILSLITLVFEIHITDILEIDRSGQFCNKKAKFS